MNDSLDRRSSVLKPRDISRAVLAWWDVHRRELPWRAPPGQTAEPYRVWLSEILLQQTTAVGATPYFHDFVARWPSLKALAAAPLDDVMQAFAGLGYYSRARNLHACANEIAARGGEFPRDEAILRELPGIGPYTAAAIAAIAFDLPAAPVDGNIARMLSRLNAFDDADSGNSAAIDAAARALTPRRPGRRFRAGDDGYRRHDLPSAKSLLRPMSARARMPRRANRFARGFPAARAAKKTTRPRRRCVLCAARRRRLSGAPTAAARAAGLDDGAARRRVGGWRRRATSPPPRRPSRAAWRRLPGFIEHVFTHFTLRLALFAARGEFRGGRRRGNDLDIARRNRDVGVFRPDAQGGRIGGPSDRTPNRSARTPGSIGVAMRFRREGRHRDDLDVEPERTVVDIVEVVSRAGPASRLSS